VRGLRAAAAERDSLHGLVGQLREANENLLVATLAAQTLRDEAEATNLRQNEFLAMLAHELRNPLAPIGMAATMLEKIPAPPPQLRNLQKIISRQVGHLARLLDDLLDAARISSGKITLSRQPLGLAGLLERTLETVQVRVSERRQNLILILPRETLVIDGDPVRLAQAFSNLLVNASKFTQDGGRITLRARRVDGRAEITLEDNGDGIAPEVIGHIFSLFTQGPRSLARTEGGLGVGLNVVRNVLEMHGGTIVAASAGLGHGSLFTVSLPLSRACLPAEAPPAPHADAVRRYRILLVEDNVDASETLSMFLRHEGYTVSTAYDGPTGLAMASTGDFDVLICDIGLPGLDGYDLIRALRKSAQFPIPFAIAVSGYGQEEDRVRAIGAGFGQYLVKPVDVDALVTLIESAAVTRLVARNR
ncbi:MAG: response regulator, partial [Burkholderiaceae bacterium]|nr:response regulator [Burkholderiaceae bacterium]